jgi:hypothetical protein
VGEQSQGNVGPAAAGGGGGGSDVSCLVEQLSTLWRVPEGAEGEGAEEEAGAEGGEGAGAGGHAAAVQFEGLIPGTVAAGAATGAGGGQEHNYAAGTVQGPATAPGDTVPGGVRGVTSPTPEFASVVHGCQDQCSNVLSAVAASANIDPVLLQRLRLADAARGSMPRKEVELRWYR